MMKTFDTENDGILFPDFPGIKLYQTSFLRIKSKTRIIDKIYVPRYILTDDGVYRVTIQSVVIDGQLNLIDDDLLIFPDFLVNGLDGSEFVFYSRNKDEIINFINSKFVPWNVDMVLPLYQRNNVDIKFRRIQLP